MMSTTSANSEETYRNFPNNEKACSTATARNRLAFTCAQKCQSPLPDSGKNESCTTNQVNQLHVCMWSRNPLPYLQTRGLLKSVRSGRFDHDLPGSATQPLSPPKGGKLIPLVMPVPGYFCNIAKQQARCMRDLAQSTPSTGFSTMMHYHEAFAPTMATHLYRQGNENGFSCRTDSGQTFRSTGKMKPRSSSNAERLSSKSPAGFRTKI